MEMSQLTCAQSRRAIATILVATLLVFPVAFNGLEPARAASVPPGYLASKVKALFMTPGQKVMTSGDTTVTIDVVISGKTSTVTLTQTQPGLKLTVTFTVTDQSTPENPDSFVIVRPDGRSVTIDRRTPFDPNVFCQASTYETPGSQTSGSQTCYSTQLVALPYACGQVTWGVSVTIDRTNANKKFYISWTQSPTYNPLYDAASCTVPMYFQSGQSYWQYNNAQYQDGPHHNIAANSNTGWQTIQNPCSSSCGATATVNWVYLQ